MFDYFLGSKVNIMMKNAQGVHESANGEVITANMALDGYITDEDDLYYYIGKTALSVDEAVKKEDTVYICLAESKSEEPEIDVSWN